MTQHSPKTAALMAYESGALSPKGRARVEKHLRGCVACQRELATIQAYEATVEQIREAPAPDLDWSKMELALEREAQAQAKKHRRGWMLPAAGVLLAAAAAALVIWPVTPEGSGRATPPATIAGTGPVAPPSTEVEAARAYADARLTLVAGRGQVHSGSSAVDASEGAALSEGDRLSTTSEGALHARLDAGLAVALAPSTELVLGTVEGAPALTLEGGRLAASVRATRTVILAGEFRIEAEVASFVIDFDEEARAVSLDVRSGEVRLVGPAVDRTITGPGLFPEGGATLEAAWPVGADAAYDAQPLLHIARPGIVRWQVGDLDVVHGAGELAMRVGAGPATISGWDERGRLFRASVTVGADGLDLTPDELRPEAPRVHAGTLSVDEISPVLREHRAAVTRCYEHQLRATPELTTRVRARISIEMTGAVESVSFAGDEMPAPMAQCMSNQIGTWIFPAPHGGPVSIEVPFNFAPR